MDKKQLKQLRYLKKEIDMLKNQIENMDYIITTDSASGSNPDFPYEPRRFRIEGIDYDDYNRKISKLKKQLQRRIDKLLNLMKETNEYINNIDDSLIRQIISLKYVDGLTWEQVAASIGGGNTPDSVRKMCNRFLEKN